MVKAKIVNLYLDIPLSGFVEALSDSSYDSFKGKGFELFEYDDQSLRARFIKKVVYKEFVVDPYGGEEEIETVRFEECGFSIFSCNDEGFLLVVYNPPRTLKPLISSLSDIARSGFYVSSIEVDISKFLDDLKEADGYDVNSIDRLQVKKVVVNESSRADIVFTSAKNAFEDAEAFLGGKRFHVGKIRMQLHVGYNRGRLEVSSSASIGCSDKLFDDVLGFCLVHFGAQV